MMKKISEGLFCFDDNNNNLIKTTQNRRNIQSIKIPIDTF